jgi:preprotein translocase subunit SecA
MITKFLSLIFGTKHQREVKRMRPIVEKINSFEEGMIAKSDSELTACTASFRERIAKGESLDSILPEAFALVRETSKRKSNERHYDVQLMGGIILHEGKISEMKTGEGKTLVATLPLYLNSLSGKGSHLITVNDYLARRDAEWMMPIYNHLGLEVGILHNDMDNIERKKAYNADITYGTNNEFGFDYLRDNMKFKIEDYVQRGQYYSIVDEVDSILIDEARTPLIISGPSDKGSDLYIVANRAITPLKRDEDFEVDEKARTVHLTDIGNDKAERAMGVGNLYAPENIMALHHISQALKANALFKKDVDYMVREGEVLIVDEFTGRVLSGRRYSDGLHQAIEAKEGVKIERESQTLASITLQNYFRLYKKLSGMTGTAATEASEFHNIYKLDVAIIPTHKPMIRKDEPDAIYLDNEDKFKAVIEDIKDCHERGQPVLVGTIAVETSEHLSYLLNQQGVPHNVLNAKQHEREADIIKEAGHAGKVTIATNMAGRGTDIKLKPEILKCGGLRIIGTERHESRRIDNQLRGRAGRQGDPGSSKFYISLDDDLMRIFGGEKIKRTMTRIGMEKGESIESKIVSRSIEKSQEKVEKHHFESRKNLIEYDDVNNQQRKIIYSYRHDVLDGESQSQELIRELCIDVVTDLIALYCPRQKCDDSAIAELFDSLSKLTGLPKEILHKANLVLTNTDALQKSLIDFFLYQYDQYRNHFPEDLIKEAEKWILLETIDNAWKFHMQTLDKLLEGIGLRSYGQKNPLVEYKRESFYAFRTMMKQIKWDIIQRLFRLRPENFDTAHVHELERERQKELSAAQAIHSKDKEATKPTTQRRAEKKVGRNEQCPCGSEKKYKQCCLKK